MSPVLVIALLHAVTSADLDQRPLEGEGSFGARAGYRYVPNAFHWESAAVNDPVVSSYIGAPAIALRLEYLPMDAVPVMFDLEWGTQRHELASEGWIETHSFGLSVSSGYLLDLGLGVHPFALLGFDFAPILVRDAIKTTGVLESLSGAIGLHAALGVTAPAIISAAPWLAPLVELRYTYAATAMRGRTYHVLGVSLMAGVQLRFETAPPLSRASSL